MTDIYTKEEWDALEQKALNPTTDVKCPRCSKSLIFRSAGNSYEVRCPTENCISERVRGL